MRRSAPFLGRQRELHTLEEAWRSVPDGSGAVALVAGEAGSGKTRLVEEFETVVAAPVLWSRCVRAARDHVYVPWTQLLSGIVRDLGDDGAGDACAEIERLLPSFDAAAAGATHTSLRTQLLDAVIAVLDRVSTNRPLVCVFEDIHWMDAASCDLLMVVASRLRQMPVLLVATYRPEDSSPSLRAAVAEVDPSATRVALSALDADAARDIAVHGAGATRDADIIDAVVERAEGNPLYLEALAAAPDPDEIPESLRELFETRMLTLSDDARGLIVVAAVMGATISRSLLSSATSLDRPHMRDAVREAVDRGFLVATPDGRGYSFRHALVRDVLVASLLPDERIDLHTEIARALTDDPAAGHDIDRVAALSHHLNAAESPADALFWSIEAARRAAARQDFEGAFVFYERALGWWDAVPGAIGLAGQSYADVLFDAAEASGNSGNLERAADLARNALDECAGTDPVRCVAGFPRALPHLWAAHRNDELDAFAKVAREHLDDVDDDDTRARFLIGLLSHLQTDGHVKEIAEVTPLLMAAVEATGDPVLLCEAYAEIGAASELTGDLELGERSYEQAAAIARAHGFSSLLGLILFNRAAVFMGRGEHASCFTWLDELEDAIEAHGLRRMVVPARNLRAVELCMTGRLAEAKAAADAVAEIAAEGIEKHVCDLTLALISLHSGDDAAVRERLESHRSLAAPSVDLTRYVTSAVLRSSALLRQGDIPRAQAVVADAFEALEGKVDHHSHGWLATVGARVEADAAERDESADPFAQINAVSAIKEIRDRYRETLQELVAPVPLLDAYCLAIDAELARVTRDRPAEHAAAAAAAYTAIEMPYVAIYFEQREAAAMLAAGDRAKATNLLKHARSEALRLGYAGHADEIAKTSRAEQLRVGGGSSSVDGDVTLSERELVVVRLLAQGWSNPQIAAELFVTASTVKAHVSKILEKFGVASRTEAVVVAQRRGLL